MDGKCTRSENLSATYAKPTYFLDSHAILHCMEIIIVLHKLCE